MLIDIRSVICYSHIMKDIPEDVRKYMSELGKKGGAKNKAKGRAYFRWVRSHVGLKKDKDEKRD